MTDNLTKALSMLTAKATDAIALEALVKAMEAHIEAQEVDSGRIDGSGLVEAPVKPEKAKHPLEDYEITKKDVGSLVRIWDGDGGAGSDGYYGGTLLSVDEDSRYFRFDCGATCWEHAAPYLDPIALHFKAFYATEDSVAPDDLGEHFAVLWSNGDIELALNVYNNNNNDWTHKKLDELWIIGYRPLKFVNPLE
jgi:hypothetical protein